MYSEGERVQFLEAAANLVSRLHMDLDVSPVTGNAYGAAAGGGAENAAMKAQRSVNGHQYALQRAWIVDEDASLATGMGMKVVCKEIRSLVEGTKWVQTRSSLRDKRMDPETVMMMNECENLLAEVTKPASMVPTDVITSAELQVSYQDP